MKKFLLVVFVFVSFVSLAFAQGASVPAVATTSTVGAVSLKGDIIDNMCASAHKDDLANFVKTHTKQCVLTPACAQSGYSIFADGKLYRVSKESNAMIANFLKKDENKLTVTVDAQKIGDELKLFSIENQK